MPTTFPQATFADVARVVGDVYAARGRAYAESGRVIAATWDPEGQRMHGQIRGSRARTYQVVADWGGRGTADLKLLGGDCSCPMEVDCKHVAALVLAAPSVIGVAPHAGPNGTGRDGGTGASATAGSSRSWEALLGGGAGTPAEEDPTIGLGLLFTIRRPSAAGVHPNAGFSVRLVKRSARGWINGNLDWQNLSPWGGGHAPHGGPVMIEPEHVRIGQALYALSTATSRWGGYTSQTRDLELADFAHAQLWPLLHAAEQEGMALRTGRYGDQRVTLSPADAEVRLDVTRPEGAAGGRSLSPAVWLAGRRQQAVMFLGAPAAHGAVLLPDPESPDPESRDPESPDPESFDSEPVDARPADAQPPDTDLPAFVLAPLARAVPRHLSEAVLSGEVLHVPADDDVRFSTEGWMRLRQKVQLTSTDGSFVAPEISPPRLVVRIAPTDDDALDLTWAVRHTIGDEVRDTPVHMTGDAAPWRDPQADEQLIASVLPEVFDVGRFSRARPTGPQRAFSHHAAAAEPHGLHAPDGGLRTRTRVADDEAVRFATDLLPALQAHPRTDVELDGPLPDYRDVSDSVEVHLATRSRADDRDWFDLDIQLSIDGQKVPMGTVFTALAEGRTRLMLPGGAHVSLEADWLRDLRALIEEAEQLTEATRGGLRISRYQADLWEQLAALGIVTAQADEWRQQVEGLLADPTVRQIDPPVGLTATLRPYQQEGFAWLAFLAEHRLGGILADDMGLGKTLQALAMVLHARSRPDAVDAPFLVLAPASVVHGWQEEAERFAPDLVVRVADATFKKMGTTAADVAAGADLVITSYTRFRLDAEHYRGVSWAGVILDEAQAVKNHRSKLYGCVRRLGAPQALAITGTPMENNLMELWSLLSISAPGLFPNPSRFKEQYLTPIERNGDRERLARLRSRIRPLVLRRTKEEVAPDLPPKQEQVLEVGLTKAHRRIYDAWLQRERRKVLGLMGDLDDHRFTVLRSLTLMRLASLHAGLVEESQVGVASAKLDALVEHLHEVADGGHRALVFSQFTSFLDLVRQRLDAEGIGHRYLDGSTRRRQDVVRDFREGDDPVFVISLKAGGVGLTLTEADYVFLLDPWWNPATEAQAIDRTHRIGQTRPVMVYRLIAADTIEQKVLALSRRKADLVDGILDEGRAFDGRLTAEDVQALFGE